MKNIKIAFWGILLGPSLLWLFSFSGLADWSDTLVTFKLLLRFSGVLAIVVMSVTIILATRSTWLEQRLNGLDKAYRLHKWLGISALILMLAHWLTLRVAGRMGMTEEKVGESLLATAEIPAGTIETLFSGLHDVAGTMANFAFYPSIFLVTAALIKWVPYKYFASTHTLLAATYLLAAFHSVVLMDFWAWQHPVGIAVAVLSLGGVVSAVLALTRQIGRRNRTSGVIGFVRPFPDIRAISSHIKLDRRWKGHKAGQFAFVTFDRKEGKHPFTIASAWDPSIRNIMIVTRGLGDYTELLPESLKEGGQALVEGPYGCFTFDDDKPRQIWVAGGIGITPFIARMKQREMTPSDQEIDLFYAIPNIQAEVVELLIKDAKAANVNLHLFVADQGERISPQLLRHEVPDWKSASVWFCGPGPFGKAIRSDLVSNGLPAGDFHQELFNMR
ncbi:ferredoxin reductase family protein [Shimia sediminis]|uniref:ferredoxin reductase family protein n=1 Tax=Shimia sediminis TaxID=2497945 RepID=UPI000F8E5834|nr:ferric reductase-like transmembrane domain-containing protein [Shimia sediminis]